MSVVKRFVWAEWTDVGTWGWQMKGMPHFDPGTGLTVAHDCIEHFRSTGNALKDEWLAFGHIIWLRAGGAYWHQVGERNTDAAWHVSGDVARFIAERQQDAPDVQTKPVEDWAEEIITDMMNHAQKELHDEHEDDGPVHWEPQLEAARGWIRRGFRKAAKLYQHDAYSCCAWFVELMNQVDSLSKSLGEAESAGTELIVRLDRSRLWFDIETKVPGWDY